MFLLSETPGKVSYFDGYFVERPNPDDHWEQAWRAFYEERDRLLLPGTKIVSPRDMSFVRDVMESAGYKALEKEEIFVETELSGPSLATFIATIRGGADAKTLGAFRFYDKKRANILVDRSTDKLLLASTETRFSFDTGYRYLGFIKPAGSNRLRASAVCRAAHNATGEAIERKTTIKRALKERHDDAAHTEAVASILYDMREALALSKDTFIVATTKESGQYIGAVQLAPLSLVGSLYDKKRLAHKFISRHALYLSDLPRRHLSHLFDTDFGDLTVHVAAVANSEVPQATTVVRSNADGRPCYIHVSINESVFLNYRDQMQDALGDFFNNAADHLDPGSFAGWNKESGLERFYFESEPTLIQSTFASLDPDILNRITKYREISDDLLTSITRPIEDALRFYGLPDPETIATALGNSLRLAMVDWRDSGIGLAWQSCFYIMRKVARESGHTGVSALILLEKCDSDAWSDAGFASRATPMLVAAVEPFLNAIQEVESARLAQRKGREEGVGDTLDSLSHELSKQTTVLFGNRLQLMSRLFKINNLERTNDTTDPRDWPESAGNVSTLKEHEQRLSRWLICPVPELLNSLKDFLFLWAGTSASTPHYDLESASIESFVGAAVTVAKGARLASLMKDFSPESVDAGEQAARLHRQYLSEMPEVQPHWALAGARIVAPAGEGEERKHQQIVLSRIFRAIVAAISNALEHSGRTRQPITLDVTCGDERFKVTVRNKCDECDAEDAGCRPDGTRAVIRNSLAHLNKGDPDVYFDRDPDNGDYWLTTFSVAACATHRGRAVRWLET